eukprot:scaffold157692_cov30-Tisochrysis_lutea.AAC.1
MCRWAWIVDQAHGWLVHPPAARVVVAHKLVLNFGILAIPNRWVGGLTLPPLSDAIQWRSESTVRNNLPRQEGDQQAHGEAAARGVSRAAAQRFVLA